MQFSKFNNSQITPLSKLFPQVEVIDAWCVAHVGFNVEPRQTLLFQCRRSTFISMIFDLDWYIAFRSSEGGDILENDSEVAVATENMVTVMVN